jgi:hypothetical protein
LKLTFLLIFFLTAVQVLFAQPSYFKSDSTSSITLSTSYFDLLRSKNSTSNTLISLKKTSAEFQSNFKYNRLFISLENERNILQIENSGSHLQFKTGLTINRLMVEDEAQFKPFAIGLFLRGNQIRSVSTIDYGVNFGFENSFHWFEKFLVGYSSYSFPWIFDLKYEDSRIDINNMTNLSKVFYLLRIHPEVKTDLTFQYEKYLSKKNKNENPTFEVEDQSTGSVTNFTLNNSTFKIPVEISFAHGQGESFLDFIYAWNSFSQSSMNNLLFNKVKIVSRETNDYKWFPSFSTSYDFYKGSVVGNIQSWPFTSVLTSLIANRLNYRLTGHVYLFTFETKKRFTFSNFSVQPELSIYQILPEFTLDNWQPSYLVFGVKDFTRNILPIRKAIIGKLSLIASYQFDSFSVSVECGQFIPLKTIKKELPSSGSTPGIVITSAQPSKIDGGRWITIGLSAGF